MTFNAASRLRSLEDRSAALGSRRCELPGMHSVPTSAVLPYASGVGGLSRRLLNMYMYMYIICICICVLLPKNAARAPGTPRLGPGVPQTLCRLTRANRVQCTYIFDYRYTRIHTCTYVYIHIYACTHIGKYACIYTYYGSMGGVPCTCIYTNIWKSSTCKMLLRRQKFGCKITPPPLLYKRAQNHFLVRSTRG